MSASSHRAPSLKGWLQSTSLLAVLAGYSLLLLINQRLAEWQRLEGFDQTSDQALKALVTMAGNAKAVDQLQREMNWQGVTLTSSTTPAPNRSGQSTPILMESDDGKQWLVGTIPLDLLDGSRLHIKIRKDVTSSVKQEQLAFWLLVVAAGGSSLCTSGLLRLVLQRGLVQPLRDFSIQLHEVKLPPTPGDVIAIDKQPLELQSIADAFNSMQHRLWTSWEQQRLFTDGVAHELRTPITLISGYAQSLLRNGAPKELTPSIQLIRSEADRMSSLISDLLDLARQDSQRLSLKREMIQADDAFLQLFERMEIKAPGRLQLDTGSEDEPDPPCGHGDADRIQQCLTTLVDNAMVYGPKDGVITLASSRGLDGGLILHVRDQGPGVPNIERELIFERFVRGSAAATGHTRGSGIGLAVVKLLMEAMGGRVQVMDAHGGGADFQLHLQPFKASAPQA